MTKSKPLSLRNVTIQDSFWKNELELVRKEVIPYQWRAINDMVEGAEPSYAMRNYKLAGQITAQRKALGDKYAEKTWPLDFRPVPQNPDEPEERFYGFAFQDSDFSKWIEAVAYSLASYPDKELEETADRAIDIVCAAQQENGYLDTYYILNNPSMAFTNLKDYHELYCFGHLTEGAVAYYEATGKDKLLKAAQKYADYIDSRIGREEGKIHGYPGHEIAEMALVRLYNVTGNPKYFELARYFIEERGKKPYFFDSEHPDEAKKHGDRLRYEYYQAHLPVRQQKEAVGHAVRAVYLYSGMADIASLTNDESLLAACRTLWENITDKKMYITGAIGATHIGESFSFDYDLPNDTAYSETCASVGLIFFARRMLETDADSRYSDVMERALYNTVLSGMALDGKSFFYVNPLEVLPEAAHRDERKHHVKPVRQKWFGCACCPPNIARLLSSVASYAYTENDDTLFMHLYVGGEVTKQYKNAEIRWNIETELPWEGKISITCEKITALKCFRNADNADCPQADKSEYSNCDAEIAVRIPDWCDSYDLRCADARKFETRFEKGYLYIRGNFAENDRIDLSFKMSVRLMKSNPNVSENQGKVALSYGPFVYCLEEKDNGPMLHRLSVIPDVSRAEKVRLNIAGTDVMAVSMPGRKQKDDSGALYSVYTAPEYEDRELVFIPYYTWANRGENEMRVWVESAE